MRIAIRDRSSYAITSREVLDNGYLKVPGRVARTGVQQYLASELKDVLEAYGITDRNPNDIINVYRPPEEVFSAESLKSYDNVDITVYHPSDMVDANTFKKVSVGHSISEGRPDGEFVVVDLLIKDKEAVNAVEIDNLVELSSGYEAEYERKIGVAEDGQSYEFVQHDIRTNHIALVDKARAGNKARLYDKHYTLENVVMNIVTLDGGKTAEVADKATAQLIQSTIDGLQRRVKDAEEEMKKMEEAKDEAETKLEEEKAKKEKMDEDLEKEKEKTSDAAISAKVKDVLTVREEALAIAGKDFVCDSVDSDVIKKEALKKARPTIDWDKQSEAYIKVAWDMEKEKTAEMRDQERVKRSTDGFCNDLKNLDAHYTDDKGAMVGTESYKNFLAGGSK